MTETVRHLQGVLADRYRIERELGQGGMATVSWLRTSGTTAWSRSRCCAPSSLAATYSSQVFTVDGVR